MTGMEFYKRLQPKYLKWLDSMDKADCINMSGEITFVKEVMFMLDEGMWEDAIPDDIDPAWFLDECVNRYEVDENWSGLFSCCDGYAKKDYFNDLMDDAITQWDEYKKEHRGNDEAR